MAVQVQTNQHHGQLQIRSLACPCGSGTRCGPFSQFRQFGWALLRQRVLKQVHMTTLDACAWAPDRLERFCTITTLSFPGLHTLLERGVLARVGVAELLLRQRLSCVRVVTARTHTPIRFDGCWVDAHSGQHMTSVLFDRGEASALGLRVRRIRPRARFRDRLVHLVDERSPGLGSRAARAGARDGVAVLEHLVQIVSMCVASTTPESLAVNVVWFSVSQFFFKCWSPGLTRSIPSTRH